MASRIQIRRDTAANWASANPVLAQGEPGQETDTGITKLGDGATTWLSLPSDGAAVRTRLAAMDEASLGKTVRSYGGVGDGIANDTAACQAALNAGRLWIPADAVCRVTSTLTALVDRTVVAGGGKIVNDHANQSAPTLALGDDTAFRTGMKVRDIHFAGNYQGSAHINIRYVNKWSISGCRIENCGQFGVVVNRASFIGRLFDNDIEYNGADGVSLGGAANAISIFGNRIKSNAFGISLFGGGAADGQLGVLSNWGINITGNDIEGNGKEGIVALGETRGLHVAGNYFEHNTFNAPAGAHIKLSAGALGIEGVAVIGNFFNGAGVNNYPVWFAAGTRLDYRGNSSVSHTASNEPLFSAGITATRDYAPVVAVADTSGATLAALETTVNALKAELRKSGILAP